jgi:hypothetical protein
MEPLVFGIAVPGNGLPYFGRPFLRVRRPGHGRRALAPKIEPGELQLICVEPVNRESWYDQSIAPAEPLVRENV